MLCVALSEVMLRFHHQRFATRLGGTRDRQVVCACFEFVLTLGCFEYKFRKLDMRAYSGLSDEGHRFRRGTASHSRGDGWFFRTRPSKSQHRRRKDMCIHTQAAVGLQVLLMTLVVGNRFVLHFWSDVSVRRRLPWCHWLAVFGCLGFLQSLPRCHVEPACGGLFCEEVPVAPWRTAPCHKRWVNGRVYIILIN